MAAGVLKCCKQILKAPNHYHHPTILCPESHLQRQQRTSVARHDVLHRPSNPQMRQRVTRQGRRSARQRQSQHLPPILKVDQCAHDASRPWGGCGGVDRVDRCCIGARGNAQDRGGAAGGADGLGGPAVCYLAAAFAAGRAFQSGAPGNGVRGRNGGNTGAKRGGLEEGGCCFSLLLQLLPLPLLLLPLRLLLLPRPPLLPLAPLLSLLLLVLPPCRRHCRRCRRYRRCYRRRRLRCHCRCCCLFNSGRCYPPPATATASQADGSRPSSSSHR